MTRRRDHRASANPSQRPPILWPARPQSRSGRDRCWGLLAILAALAAVVLYPGSFWAQERAHSVFFEGSDHELNIYYIYGKAPGPTLMLIGGIQGDEPGGFLSADHFIDISLRKGNLIVVPRANFRSIVLNRRKINADMNRKFADDPQTTYETEIVSILKQLISESDCLLNLHDGSGFFSESWVSEERNPKRYGQSIIADTDRYPVPGSPRVIELGHLARTVCSEINRLIENPLHRFHFNNHRTRAADTLHKEQRKSATYFALTVCNIPAFGVETSKALPLETKVRHHNLAINAFMNQLGIVPETPGLNLKPPKLNYLVVAVNDGMPIVVKNQQTLQVAPGDVLTISHIESNYERGLTADVVGVGSINDIGKPLPINSATRIVVRKDLYSCGSVFIQLGAAVRTAAATTVSERSTGLPGQLFFKIDHGGTMGYYPNFGTVPLVRGDRIELVDVVTGSGDPSDLVVNFKGFVGNVANNTGEDRGQLIDTGRDLWPRYALDPEGRRYQVVVEHKSTTLGKLIVEFAEPTVAYVVVDSAKGDRLCLAPGEIGRLDADDRFRVARIVSNVSQPPALVAAVTRVRNRPPQKLGPSDWVPLSATGESAGERRQGEGGRGVRIDVHRGERPIAAVYIRPSQEREGEE
jgi:hypothetical protein